MYARAIYPPNTPSRFAGLGYDPGWALGHIILLPLLSNLNKSMTMNHTLKFQALDHPVISEVLSEESGEQFLLLHNAGDNPQFTTVAVL